MRMTVLGALACLALSLPATASASDLQTRPAPLHAANYDAAPAVVYIPTEGIDLTPVEMCPIAQGGRDNSGLGCIVGLDAATTTTPAANVQDVVDGVTTALAPFNILVTTTRPPEYVPYLMILVGDQASEMGTSYTCAGAGIDCDGPKRNEIVSTVGSTMNCTDPDPVQAALIAFGYASGLENTDNAMDPMYYRPFDAGVGGPDYTMPGLEFQDACATLVETIDGEDNTMTNPSPCPGSYHDTYCDGNDGQINTFQELVGVYKQGPWVEDTTPPTVDTMQMPAEGDVLPAQSDLDADAMITDDSGLVFARWTIQSDAFLGADGFDATGALCKGTNKVCILEFEGTPYFDASGGFPFSEITKLPGGDFTLTLEASDLSGNAIEPIVVHFSVEGGGGADTTAGSDGGNASEGGNDGNDSADGGSSSGGSGDTGGTGNQNDDSSGCSCRTDDSGSGGAAALLLGVIGFGWSRRRRAR